VLVSALVVVTVASRELLLAAGTAWIGAGRQTEHGLLIAAAVFVLASGMLVLVQSLRLANRVAGPEYRLIEVLRRIRSGDLTVRAHLRRADLLHDLAGECNELLEWLNANPPRGAVTGGDVIEIGHAPAADGDLLEALRR
jgi:methyl-accepting chemotaxis protein